MEQLAADFQDLGVRAGDTVMLHASVRAVGEVAGGPDRIHLALKRALTEAGTLLMYAGCPDCYDEVGRGHLSAEQEAEILEKLPAFDPLTDRAQRDHGAMVELFRSYPGTLASSHVTRFAAWGKHAAYLVANQPWNYTFGRGSPLERFLTLDGGILLLGSDHDSVTFLHYAEHTGDFPGKRIARFRVPIEVNGRRVWREVEEFDSSDAGVHANWPPRFFALLVDGFLNAEGARGGRVGDALSFLFPARGLLEFALPRMKAAAAGAGPAAGGQPA
jgi:aminoglycoside 3-N-acetyltransferase